MSYLSSWPATYKHWIYSRFVFNRPVKPRQGKLTKNFFISNLARNLMVYPLFSVVSFICSGAFCEVRFCGEKLRE
jgi:hypothetical protein